MLARDLDITPVNACPSICAWVEVRHCEMRVKASLGFECQKKDDGKAELGPSRWALVWGKRERKASGPFLDTGMIGTRYSGKIKE